MHRPTREHLHLLTACLWARRSVDPRLKVGAIITTYDLRRVLAFGYNGPAAGLPPEYVRDIPGDSGCLHAEMNAIANVDSTIPKKVMFCTHSPCETCAQLIINSNIHEFYFINTYRDILGLHLLEYANVKVRQCGISEKLLWESLDN